MDDERPPGDPGNPDDMLFLSLDPGNHRLIDPGLPELFTLEDLRAAHRLFGDEESVKNFLDDLEGRRLHAPGIVWSEGSLLMVAHVSEALRERIRRRLGWSEEKMTEKMNQLRPPPTR